MDFFHIGGFSLAIFSILWQLVAHVLKVKSEKVEKMQDKDDEIQKGRILELEKKIQKLEVEQAKMVTQQELNSTIEKVYDSVEKLRTELMASFHESINAILRAFGKDVA